MVSFDTRGTWRITVPQMKAPNTAWMPIFSVSAAHRNVVTMMTTRSASGVLK